MARCSPGGPSRLDDLAVGGLAWVTLYLASDEAKFVAGSELVIDGGYTAR